MWFLYLDESGDLGFNFEKKQPSKYFTISILVIKSVQNNRTIINAVKKTLKRKLNPRKKRHRNVHELKANRTSFEIKSYFYYQVAAIPFSIFSMTLNKQHLINKVLIDNNRLYNFISRKTIEKIVFNTSLKKLELIIDKSKNKSQIREFNYYVIKQLEATLDPMVPINIYHRNSENDYGLKAADMFSWGIFRKYERSDSAWFDIFKDKVKFDQM